MTASCVKRLARATDFDSVYRISMHPAVIPFLSFEPMTASDFKPFFAGLLESQRFFVFDHIASVGGFAHVSRHAGRSHHTAFISTLAVDPEFHATGFAQAMMIRILRDLRSEAVRRVELVVETDNLRAIRFYKRNGFSTEGTLRGSYRRAHEDRDIDSHIMAIVYENDAAAKPSTRGERLLLVR
jgi:ribosomal protein S18 acetylase RimI-like enzyme